MACLSRPASAQADTLLIQNNHIALKLVQIDGHLTPYSLTDRNIKIVLKAVDLQPLCNLSKDAKPISPVNISRHNVEATSRHGAYERVTFSQSFDKYDLRQHIDLFMNLPVWVHSVEVMLREPLSTFAGSGTEGKEMIEAADRLTSAEAWYSRFPFTGQHCRIHSVRFADATDYHSNPVQVDHYLAYAKKARISGNVFKLQAGEEGPWHFALKESPLGSSQVAYPGYDAAITHGSLELHGPGIDPELVGVWQEAYRVVYGTFAESETELDQLLLSYKLARYQYLPEVDHTFTLNTWGDRNRDARVSEDFILKELDAAARLGITHYQIDDGWQAALSRNSAQAAGEKWESWSADDWQPHPTRFPNGLTAVAQKAGTLGMELGLWYNPGAAAAYADTALHLSLWRQYRKQHGVRLFKIDGVALGSKSAESELAYLLTAAQTSHPDLVFNMDVTAGVRGGYHFMDHFGSIFLENRYTDWGNFYPHLTLRNAWLLGQYLPVQRLQLSFLNMWRNTGKYPDDGLQPAAYGFDYLFATTMMGQPLAWMEATGLPDEAFEIKELVDLWQAHRSEWSTVPIMPIGEEPGGYSFTGFGAWSDGGRQYFLLFRENTERDEHFFEWPYLIPAPVGAHILYQSAPCEIELRSHGIQLHMSEKRSFVWGYIE